MVRISGSHPGGPGSIPGNGILFIMQKYDVKIIFLGMVKPGDNIPITERERMIEEVVKPNRKTLRVKQRFDLSSKL